MSTIVVHHQQHSANKIYKLNYDASLTKCPSRVPDSWATLCDTVIAATLLGWKKYMKNNCYGFQLISKYFCKGVDKKKKNFRITPAAK